MDINHPLDAHFGHPAAHRKRAGGLTGLEGDELEGLLLLLTDKNKSILYCLQRNT
jgi:hypothetical protein